MNRLYNYIYGIIELRMNPSKDFLSGLSYVCMLDDAYVNQNYYISSVAYVPDKHDPDNNFTQLSLMINGNVILDFDCNTLPKTISGLSLIYDNDLIIRRNELSIVIPSFYFIITLIPLKTSIKESQIVVNLFDTINDVPYITKLKADVGICFSGGGPRSFSATIGYIRALYSLDLISKIKYASCVSGSTWALVPLVYSHEPKKMIGYYDLNGILTMKDINKIDPEFLGSSLMEDAFNKDLVLYALEGITNLSYGEKSRIWGYMLGKFLLKDIHMTVPNPDLPFLITSTNTVKDGKRGSLLNTDYDLVTMTPYYCGKNGQWIETQGFHSKTFQSISPTKAQVTVGDFNKFDMIGSSSTAYGIITDMLHLSSINPSYRFSPKLIYHDCIDGGVIDNAGIIPLLQRGVKRIVSFCNSNEIDVDPMIMQLFFGNDDTQYFRYFNYMCNIKVFKNGGEELLEQFKTRKYVVLKDIEVMDNAELFIKGYLIEELAIMFLNKSADWYNERLDKDVQKVLDQDTNFPLCNTVFENDGWIEKEILAQLPSEIHLLSDSCYWNLMHCPEVIDILKKN